MMLDHRIAEVKADIALNRNGSSIRDDHLDGTRFELVLGDDQNYRGGYYTPVAIANFLVSWAISRDSRQVLEPSAGDGQIVGAIAKALGDAGKITAIELYSEEAKKAAIKGGERCTVVTGDFFTWYLSNRPDGAFDAVLGNPPFIRYQQFNDEHRQAAFALMREQGLHPTRLTNAWLPFLAVATRALRDGGRLALVLPAEFLQVKYASEVRAYLAAKYSHLTVVTFRKLVFPQIQQETILLLGIRHDNPAAEVSFVELEGPEDLGSFRSSQLSSIKEDLNHATEKWTQYYLTSAELALVREIEGTGSFLRLGEIAEVDVGIVTGRNEFFVVTEEEARTSGVLPWCLPLVSKSSQIRGVVLRDYQWRQMVAGGGRCYLIQLGDLHREELPTEALAYVMSGERRGFHEGYKCRIRMPNWWHVPSVWGPDAFLTRQVHDGPRIVHNPSGLTCTDTIHRVRTTGTVDGAQLAAISMNSLTFAFAELKGRSYGGGVLELEPSEAESLPIPVPNQNLDVEVVDWLARQESTERVLDHVDRSVLEPSGLSRSDIAALREIWHKLFVRRLRRKRV